MLPHPAARRRCALLLLALALLFTACGNDSATDDSAAGGAVDGVDGAASDGVASDDPDASPSTPSTPTTPAAPTPDPGVTARVEVIGRYPHDTSSFTQGLELDDDVLIESSGQYGESRLRIGDLESGDIHTLVELDDRYFGEGITVVDDRVIMLTWKEGDALVFDRSTLELVDTLTYAGQGWGLCEADGHLVMSDGSSTLTLRDADSFEPVSTVPVERDGVPVSGLNELECVGDDVYANVWTTDEIVRIDTTTGQVRTTIDASGLLDTDEAAGADILNGIAYVPSSGTFLITGKYWPAIFEVRLVTT